MTTTLRNVTFDCSDARKVADFWSALTGWNVYYDDDPEVVVAPHFPPDGLTLLFVPVPEDKTVKNRVHLDLQPSDCSRDEQVTRALDLGATVVADHREDDGSGWVTMADPEGNEFCIERSQAERPVAPRVFRIEG
ncbi:MAG TPA: VOC family protein [Jiangellaceae bacterium]|nr:VOC family protein [Jiangellaceae bacterium]